MRQYFVGISLLKKQENKTKAMPRSIMELAPTTDYRLLAS